MFQHGVQPFPAAFNHLVSASPPRLCHSLQDPPSSFQDFHVGEALYPHFKLFLSGAGENEMSVRIHKTRRHSLSVGVHGFLSFKFLFYLRRFPYGDYLPFVDCYATAPNNSQIFHFFAYEGLLASTPKSDDFTGLFDQQVYFFSNHFPLALFPQLFALPPQEFCLRQNRRSSSNIPLHPSSPAAELNHRILI